MSDHRDCREGGCLCGGVRYRAAGPVRPVVVCHCGQCRRTHGGPAPYADLPRERLTLTHDATLRWYESSPGVRRGFCSGCGASLFWGAEGSGRISVAAGTLDDPTGLTTAGHIYVAHRGDWEIIADGLPQFPDGDNGALDVVAPPNVRR
jgi:hypothetical protein